MSDIQKQIEEALKHINSPVNSPEKYDAQSAMNRKSIEWLTHQQSIISKQIAEIESLTEKQSEHIDIIHHAYRVLSVMPDSIVVRMWLKRYENEMIKGESPC